MKTSLPMTAATHKLHLADTELSFDCSADDPVLRGALRAGLSFPYECNVGSCGSCRFELISGTVEMAWPEAPAWNDRDRERQRFLGCQAIAKSDCVIKVRQTDKYTPPHLPQRQSAVLSARRVITHDISEFRFELDAPMFFEPGQYVLLTLPGIEGARAYSMSSVASDGRSIDLQVRLVPDGNGSATLFRSEPGSRFGIDGPYGMAWLRRDAPRDILCLAGGSGLAPMISIARAAMNEPALAGRNLHFFYGGRTARDICGEDMLRELPGWGSRLFFHPAVSTPPTPEEPWAGAVGFVHELARERFAERLGEMEIYFAGPPAMAMALIKMLRLAKISFDQVHFDQFY
jgi:toluene monooxygenase electron transfer component